MFNNLYFILKLGVEMDDRKKRLVGYKLKLARQNKGLSIEDAAKLVNKSTNSIYKYESGRGGYRITTLSVFAEAYGVEEDYFFDWSDLRSEKNIISDETPAYNNANVSGEINEIVELLREYPEVRQKVKDYLLSYRKGGHARLSSWEGIVDALSADEIQEIFPKLLAKFKEAVAKNN